MAGILPTKKIVTGRKQWTVHGGRHREGPRGSSSSLKRLRSQLASEGCAESQLVLAKRLLEETCETEERRGNDRLGIYWLMKASEQGNEEATALLKACFRSKRGINQQNYLDVKRCIEQSQNEKLARRAAKQLFGSLSNGEEFITTRQLEKRMLRIVKEFEKAESDDNGISSDDDYEDEALLNDFSSSSDDEPPFDGQKNNIRETDAKLSEQQLVAAAVDYTRGTLPIIDRPLTLSSPNLEELDHLSVFHRLILHPFLALKILYYKTIRFFGRRRNWASIPGVQSDVQVLLVFLLYCLFNSSSTTSSSGSNNVLYLFPVLVYYVSVFVMVVSTFQMLQSKRDFLKFRIWSRLFITYCTEGFGAREAENHFIRSNLRPYAHFFLALLVNFVVYPVVSAKQRESMYQSELTVIAFCFTFMTLHSFSCDDLTTLASFAVNVLAKYPYENDQVVNRDWRFLDLKVPSFASYLVGNGVEFCLNFRLVFFLSIPLLFVKLAAKDNWRGTYKVLLPHCVTLSWLQIVIIGSQGATTYGLLRATLALVGLVLFLPLIGIGMIVVPVYALTRFLLSSENRYALSVFVGLVLSNLMLTHRVARTRFARLYLRVQFLTTALAIVFIVKSTSTSWFRGTVPMKNDTYPKGIEWEHFESICQPSAWEKHGVGRLQTQLRCSQLHGLQVEWEGYVDRIAIVSVTNAINDLIERFPSDLRPTVRCFFGEKQQQQQPIENCPDESCRMMNAVFSERRECSLAKYDTYEFEISLKIHSGLWGQPAEILLKVGDRFKNFTLALKPKDRIRFRGRLINDNGAADGVLGGGGKPSVVVNSMRCLDCKNEDDVNVEDDDGEIGLIGIVDYVLAGIKFVLNVLLGPVVMFK